MSSDLEKANLFEQPRKKTRRLTAEQLKQVEYCSGLCLEEKDIAGILGYTIEQFHFLKKDDPNLGPALSMGKAKAVSAVAQAAYNLAKSGKSPASTMFWLKTQAGWAETQPVKPPEKQTHEVIFQTRIGEKGQIMTEHLESGK